MTGHVFPYVLSEISAPRLGLIALQSDETIELDMRRLLPEDTELLVSRVPSDEEVSSESLARMEGHLSAAAALFPAGMIFDVMGYGCTSGTAQIGAKRIAETVRQGIGARQVTQPLSSLVAACRFLGIKRLALLSPYVAEVSEQLRTALSERGVETPVFGSFEVMTEAAVVRIDAASVKDAARALMNGADVDALFISCTNLRTLDVIDPLESELGKPVLSSNQVLAWHMQQEANLRPRTDAPGRLFG